METKTLTGTDLLALGYPEGKVIGTALYLLKTHYTESTLAEQTQLLSDVLKAPEQFLEHPVLSGLAEKLLEPKAEKYLALPDTYAPFKVYDAAGIEEGALKQMRTTMRLPIVVAGALMPDAHRWYGLQIGGVLAPKKWVIRYRVWVAGCCR